MYIKGLDTRDLPSLGKRSIARHLGLLCAAILTPTLILIGLLAWSSTSQLRERTETQVEDVAVAAAAAMDRQIAATEAMLSALATLPTLGSGEFAQFHDRASRMADAQDLVISLREPDGRQLLSTGVAYGATLPRKSLPVDRLVISSGMAKVGDLELDSGRQGFYSVVVPVLVGERVRYLLTATAPAKRAAEALHGVLPSSVWAASLSDRNGLVVGRTRDHEQWVGRPITEPLREAAVVDRGTWTGPSHEGQPIIGGFARSRHTGWLAAVGVNRSEVAVPARSSALAVGMAAVLFALLSVAFAMLFARHLVRPLAQLARRADDLAEGRPVKPLPSGFQEVDAVGSALASAAEAIDQRDQALRNAYFELEAAKVQLEHEVASRTREVEETAAKLFQSQKMESLGRLTGGVAHDFNNLLTPIIGYLDLLRTRHQDERSRRLIDGAMESAERAAALVRHLLSFARRQEIEPQAVRPADLVGRVRSLLERSVGPRVRLIVDVPDDLPAIMVDPHQLELSLLNLAVNARDAMPDGGTLSIYAVFRQVDGRAIAGLEPGAYVRFAVRDTGQGMDAETLQRATEPFFTTKGVGQGTGLGLSMTQGLALQSGGAFQLRSSPGRGTTALMWLPVAENYSRDTERPSEPVRRVTGRPTVLLVDDDPRVLQAEAESIRDLGYLVQEARSGEEALAILADHREISLLVTDQSMAGMSGLDLVGAARRQRPDLPVLLTSGHTDMPDLPRGVELMPKPFRQAQLAARLAAMLGAAVEQGSGQ